MTEGSAVGATKALVRARVRASRTGRPSDEREAAARDLAGRALTLREVAGASCIAVYRSRDDEPGTQPLVGALLAAGCTVLLPRVLGTTLEWVPVTDGSAFAIGAFGVAEPQGADTRDLREADVVIVPALAVDTDGRRLGQGGGFYDRALVDAPGTIVALVFDDEVIDEVPTEVHDHRVDVVVTPTRTLHCR